jgi:hypothetical protein
MGAIAQVKLSTLTTGVGVTSDAAVSVNKTFDPQGFVLPGVARWVDRSGGIAIGYPTVTLSNRLPTKTSRLNKVVVKLVIPTLEVTAPSTATGIQPQPTKAYDHTVVMEFILPERGTEAERIALMNQARSLLMGTINASDGAPSDATGSPVVDAVRYLDSPY